MDLIFQRIDLQRRSLVATYSVKAPTEMAIVDRPFLVEWCAIPCLERKLMTAPVQPT
jgi:hypothetical protein